MKRAAPILLALVIASLSSAARICRGDEPPPTELYSGPRLPTSASARGEVAPPAPTATPPGFDYGSYGRVGVGSDLRGHEGYSTSVVSHGSRLEEAPYLELDLYYSGVVDHDPVKRWRVVLAPAFAGGDLFHYSGTFGSHFAVRNAYAETENVGLHGLHLWAGSRMLRGDDIYLFDYWPLDNLNTVGGGASYARESPRASSEIALHAGLNRLDDLYQYERLDVPPRGLGPPGSSTVLDRPRFVTSLKLSQRIGDAPGFKVALYGELHLLPEGQYVDPTDMRKQALPSDSGWVVGAQLGGWLRPFVFANLWLRVAGGLAAYGELSVPTQLDPTRRVSDAREIVGALSANWESRFAGVMVGAYVRRFRDASTDPLSSASYTEGIIAARPHLYWSPHFHTAVELSYQSRRADGVDYLAGRVLSPSVFRLSVLPLVAPLGRGTYSRPQIYVVYTVSRLNDDARLALFDPSDVRYGQGVVHYLGIGAEWWFNSSYR